jgi:ketosteroid isomerase-like protein
MSGHSVNVTFRLVVASLLLGAPLARAASEPESAEVRAALELYKQALIKKDRAAFDKVLHPDLSYGHSSGLIETKTQAIDHVLGSDATWETVNFADTSIRVRRDTAYATGKVEFRQRGKSGKATVINLVVLHVFVKGPGRTGWQMIARQATRPASAAAP